MEYGATKLPWEALKRTEGNIPWSALSEFAAAVVHDESLTDSLLVLYDQAYESDCDHPHYEEYYIPAIFALAAPQLSDDKRREIGTLLIEVLRRRKQSGCSQLRRNCSVIVRYIENSLEIRRKG